MRVEDGGYRAGAEEPGSKDLRSLVSGVIRDMVGGIFEAYAAAEAPDDGGGLDEGSLAVILAKKDIWAEDPILSSVSAWRQDRLLYVVLGGTNREMSPGEMKAAGLNPPEPEEDKPYPWRTFEMETQTAGEVSDELVSLMEMLHDPFGLPPSEAMLRLSSSGGELYANAARRVASDPRHSGILIEAPADASRRNRRILLLLFSAVVCGALIALLA